MQAVTAAWGTHHDEPLFVGSRRERLGTSGIWRMITGLVATTRPQISQETSPHTLRHTFAYHYLDSHPGDLVGLAALLGHSTIEVTRIYVEHTAEELARRVEAGRLNAY
jgi:site-specific recombinase XerD